MTEHKFLSTGAVEFVALVVAWVPALVAAAGAWVVQNATPSFTPMHAYVLGATLGFIAGVCYTTFADEIKRRTRGPRNRRDLHDLAESWRDRAANDLPNNTVGNIGRVELRRCAGELEALAEGNDADE